MCKALENTSRSISVLPTSPDPKYPSTDLSIPPVALRAVVPTQLIEAIRVTLVGVIRLFRVVAGPHVMIGVATSRARHRPSHVEGRFVSIVGRIDTNHTRIVGAQRFRVIEPGGNCDLLC